MRCVECGSETAEAAQRCARCGAPPARPMPVAAGPAAAAAGDAWPTSAWMRHGQRYFLISLIFFLILYLIGVVGLLKTSLDSGPHTAMGWVLILSVAGVFLSLVLVEASRNQFRARQLGWGLVPILSLGLLAFVPFLWLALIRHRARHWMVFAAYLAAVVVVVYVVVANYYNSAAWSATYVMIACLVVIAATQAVVAFSPAAGVPSWREARAASDSGRRQQPVMDAVGPEAWQ